MKALLAAAALAASVASPVLAQADLVVWGQSGDWTILTNPNRGNGCVAQVALSDGSTLRLGFDRPGSGTGYISSFNPAWSRFERGETYDVTINFGETIFVGKGRGEELIGMPGVEVLADNLNLLNDLARAETVTFSAGEASVGVALKGSFDALTKALECQAEQG